MVIENTTVRNDCLSGASPADAVRLDNRRRLSGGTPGDPNRKRLFVVALLLIYTILATQFQSFSQPTVVMAAIPLSLIGVCGGFLLSAKPIGLISLVGAVGLTGIVVNDSLVLVDFINKRRGRGMTLDEAIVESGKLRLRPIF